MEFLPQGEMSSPPAVGDWVIVSSRLMGSGSFVYKLDMWLQEEYLYMDEDDFDELRDVRLVFGHPKSEFAKFRICVKIFNFNL